MLSPNDVAISEFVLTSNGKLRLYLSGTTHVAKLRTIIGEVQCKCGTLLLQQTTGCMPYCLLNALPTQHLAENLPPAACSSCCEHLQTSVVVVRHGNT